MTNIEKSVFLFDKLIRKDANIANEDKRYTAFIDKNNGNRMVEAKDKSFHMIFCKSNGFTMKWGKTLEEDPTHCPFGPEIADIELTKICSGIRQEDGSRKPCPWCYKSNTGANKDYMSFDTFKHIFDKVNVNKTLTQIAFGTDASLLSSANPDYWMIFDYCKKHNVTPNVTIADVDNKTAERIVKTFGAVAVSYYPLINKNRCYDSIKRILDAAKKIDRHIDVNIHAMVSEETFESLFELINDYNTDERLKGMNAIVFLSLKQKGRGEHFNRVTNEQFKKLIEACDTKKISYGMDSCGAPKYLKAISDRPEAEQKILKSYVESCESTLFSLYIDCKGIFYPCSFMEHAGDWQEGIDCKKIQNFENEVWNNELVKKWRDAAIHRMNCNGGCNYCPFYNV